MSIEVSAGPRVFTLHFWWEERSVHERLHFRDRLEARGLLARLSSHGHMASLRRLAAAQLSSLFLDDAALLDLLASWLSTGQLRAGTSPVHPLMARGEEPEEAPSAQRPRAIGPANEADPVEEPLPPPPVDKAQQAAVLREAAKYGVAFCEECAQRAREQHA